MQTLGEGEFGKVKLAVDGNGQEYAVKFIRKSLLANPDFKAKLYREIEIMQVNKHKLFDNEKKYVESFTDSEFKPIYCSPTRRIGV